MSASPLPAVADTDFRALLTIDGPSLQVVLTGTADLNVQKQLDAFLTAVHECATGHMATNVVVDLRELEFMNSSCLKCVVSWIFSVRTEPVERQYRIVFMANPQAQWQRRSLYALSCMAAELVSVQE
jgi:hypothetical protein